jgi:hypothetical protein
MNSTNGNVHINGTHKNNNDNKTRPIFIGLNKATQNTRTPQEKTKNDGLMQMYFNVNDQQCHKNGKF